MKRRPNGWESTAPFPPVFDVIEPQTPVPHVNYCVHADHPLDCNCLHDRHAV